MVKLGLLVGYSSFMHEILQFVIAENRKQFGRMPRHPMSFTLSFLAKL
jgi:hypothetical protein